MTESSRPDFVTVVSGLPRSGTSLAMQMLAAGGLAPFCDAVRAPDPDNPRGYLEYAPVKATARDASWVPLAIGRAVKVVHALVPALPRDHHYRVILMRRPLDAVMASQRAMLVRAGREAPDDDARLARAFEAQLAELERWLDAEPAFRWLPVDAPALIRDPLPTARAIADFLGLDLDVAAMARAVDPDLWHQRA